MGTKTYTIAEPLSGTLYRDVLDYAIGRSATFLLVVRDSLGLSSRATELLERLRCFLANDYRGNRWPGTELLEGTARIVEYTYTPESRDVLKEAAGGFCDWLQPDLPEDLCLLRPSGDVWMATISHEGDAFFEMQTQELKAMVERVPGLADYLKED